jgi:hypothetical protein
MIELLPISDPAAFVATREALHAVAEHVVAKARYLDDGEIRLTAYAGGFATPLLSGGRRVRVIGTEIAVDTRETLRRAPITTVAAAAAFVGIEPGFPTELYQPATELHADAHLNVDDDGAAALATWYEFTAAVLRQFATEIPWAQPSEFILWPEHFDQAFFTQEAAEQRRANFGASPGDGGHPDPYLYVGPWSTPPSDTFWNAEHFTGAVLSLSTLVGRPDPADHA